MSWYVASGVKEPSIRGEEVRERLEPFEWWTNNVLSMFLLVENLDVKEGIKGAKDILENYLEG